MKRWNMLLCLHLITITLNAYVIHGFVSDRTSPISYASIYLKNDPATGTVTNGQGFFSLSIDNREKEVLVISFIGYETYMHQVSPANAVDTLHILLKEQPIALEETIVSAKAGKKKKRQTMEELLHLVRMRMDTDFPDIPIRYRVVSDVGIYSNDTIITFEEMIGYVQEIPDKESNGHNSIQFKGELCKRYIQEDVENSLRMLTEEMKSDQNRLFAEQTDSGTIIHRKLWGGHLKSDFDNLAQKTAKWSISRENSELSVLTYSESRNVLGIVKVNINIHYIIDSYHYRLHKIVQEGKIHANIPFGYKLDSEQLALLNAINVTADDISKFRLKKIDGSLQRNVLYNITDSNTSVKEKNMIVKIQMTDNNGNKIPIHTTAKAKAVSIQTKSVQPYTEHEQEKKIPRKIIPVSQTY